jgi:hypothetical protein
MGVWDILGGILSGGAAPIMKAIAPEGSNDIINSFASLGLSDLSGDISLLSLGKEGFKWTDKVMGTEQSGLYGGGLNQQLGELANVVIPAYFGYVYGVPAAVEALSGAGAAAEAADAATTAATIEASLAEGGAAVSEGGTAVGEGMAGAYTINALPGAEFDAYLSSTAPMTVSGNTAGLYVGEGVPAVSAVDKLLSSKVIANLTAKAGAQLLSPTGGNQQQVVGGSSSTRVTPPIQEQDTNVLLRNILGSNETSNSNKSMLSNNEQNVLTRSFLGGSDSSSMSSKANTNLAFRSLGTSNTPKKKVARLKNVSVASPFYQEP